MKDFILTSEQVSSLSLKHRMAREKRYADKLKAVILLGTGWSLKQVSEVLLLDEETLRSYVKKYLDGDVASLLSDKYSGNNANKLSDVQKSELTVYLENNLHSVTQEIVRYVHKKYNVNYSRSGMTSLLHSLGFTYKKPKLVPEKLDTQAQDEYLEYFYNFIKNKAENEAVLFYDSTHPNYGTVADYGWIKKGTDSLLPSPASRKRVNISGAVELTTFDVITTYPKTVNAETTIDFLQKVTKKYCHAKKIHIILDNAPYHHASTVKEYAEQNKINLVFLPPYSPNLNLAERLWGFMRRKVLASKYFETFNDFKKAIVRFFRGIHNRKNDLAKLMTLDFQEFEIGEFT
jgi:transposase